MAAKRNGKWPVGGELHAENRGWLLYRIGLVRDGWQRIKLVSKVARQRANFTLSWGVEQQALARCSEAVTLDVSMPEVFDWVVAEMVVR